ncbi:MAG: AsmA family protein [Bacteroidales bacterium]|nr:AsmA family protein [Bacteroidales bacterium]
MKKFFKITGITIAVLLVLLIALPVVFKGKIVEQVRLAINENVNAQVDFGSFRISLLRNFPNVSLRINDLTVVGVDEFQGDTLANVGSFFISVNIMSIFGSDGYEIKSIRVDNASLLLKVLEDGKANWDIAIPSEETVEPDEDFDFKIALRSFRVRNSQIIYDDRYFDFYTRLENFNHSLSGDFTADFTSIAVRNTTAESLYVSYEGIPFLWGVSLDLTADIDANLNTFEFTFKDNSLILNDLVTVFEGTFAWPGEAMDFDFTFSSPQTEFKSFLSLVPAIFAKEYEGLNTSGSMAFNGHVKGVYDENRIPGFGINIDVENGMFQYPGLPAAVTDVNIITRINNPGNDADLTVVDVSRFTMNVAGNPVDFKMNLRTPVSDPNIDAQLKGRIDLGQVKDFYPLDEGASLIGLIESDMTAKGRLSSIENERYNEFLFTGRFSVNNMNYVSEAFPQGVEISTADLRFSSQFAELRTFRTTIGESDITASGRIDNILGFVLSDEMLRGNFDVRSSFFNLNQFMAEEPEEVPDDEPITLSAIEIPANINFLLQGNFEKILFGDLEITNARGNIRIADQAARLENLRMNMLDGVLVLNGSYIARDITRPEIDFGLNISNFDIQKTFNTFNTFSVIAPIGERARGRFSANFTLRSLLDQNLDPVLNSLAGSGSLQSSAVTIENSPALIGLAENLRLDMFRKFDVRDILIFFEFKDGGVQVEPFDISFGRSSARISGTHSFDQSINYMMGLVIPRAEFGGAANQALDNLISQAAGRGLNITPSENVNIGVGIAGTVSEPRISISLAETAGGLRDQVQDAIQDAVQDVVDEIRDEVDDRIDDASEQVREELERRAQQVVTEAERQATNIRREAKNAADAIRSEVRTNARRLEDEASGPIAKAAARRTGEELIRAADQRAGNLEREADERATQLVREANHRADRIRAGEE